MVNNDTVKTEVNTQVENLAEGWVHLFHTDGYNIYLKTFYIDGKPVTAYLDNWSVAPIGLYDFDVKDVVIDEDWTFMHVDAIFKHSNMSEISVLKDKVPADVYKEIEWTHSELFNE